MPHLIFLFFRDRDACDTQCTPQLSQALMPIAFRLFAINLFAEN
jgi:hypothetical protein